MIKIRSFENIESLISETVNTLENTFSTAANIMLSGGSTPYVIYNKLAAAPCSVHPQLKLFLSDERMQPFDSDENNANNLEPMLKALDCETQFIRVNTALSIQEAAIDFESKLEPLNNIDLGFLGMGNDGHTAGFFTPEQANRNTGPLTLHTARPDGMQGISVTPAFLKRVRKIIVLVTGESKREIINTLLNDPQTIAAGIALYDHPNIELWTDLTL